MATQSPNEVFFVASSASPLFTTGRMSRYAVAVDVGGTFTDVTLSDLETAEVWSLKTPTTPKDPSIGFLTGVEKVLALAGASPEDVVRVLHGTTIATNAI